MPSIRRGLPVLLTLLAMLVAWPHTLVAQPLAEGYPDLEPFADNLPAMTLTGRDWDLPDITFDSPSAYFVSPENYATQVGVADGGNPDDVLDELEDLGFQGLYASRVSAGRLDDDPGEDVAAFSLVAAFDDAAGAEAFLGFDLPFAGAADEQEVDDLGDAARLVTLEHEQDESLPDIAQVLQIQRDHLVGNIFLRYPAGTSIDPVDPDVVIEHGERLLERIDAELADPTPALFRTVLRPAMDDVVLPTWFNDGYFAVDGAFTDTIGFDDASLTYWDDYVADHDIEAEYLMRAWAVDADDTDIGFIFTSVTRFADDDAAAGWLASTDDGQWNLAENSDLEAIDDLPRGVAGFRANYDYPESPAWHVITLQATDGDLGATLVIASEDEADLDDALDVLAAQVDCLDLDEDEICEPMDVGGFFA